jgi:hypothetical protein
METHEVFTSDLLLALTEQEETLTAVGRKIVAVMGARRPEEQVWRLLVTTAPIE